MLKLLNTTFGQNDLSIGFERDGARRQLEITKRAANPYPLNIRGKFHGRTSLKDVSVSELQENGTYGLRYGLTFKKKNDNDAINRVLENRARSFSTVLSVSF